MCDVKEHLILNWADLFLIQILLLNQPENSLLHILPEREYKAKQMEEKANTFEEENSQAMREEEFD